MEDRKYFFIKFPKAPKSLTNSRGVYYDEARELYYKCGNIPDDLKPFLIENYYYYIHHKNKN